MADYNLDDPIQLAKALISYPSVTPDASAAMDALQGWLERLGFTCQRFCFGDDKPVDNLYARLGELEPNLCFAGHLDVVPTGPLDAWSHDPWGGVIQDGILFGRGVVDMKGAVAAWVAALARLDLKAVTKSGSLSLLITGDEEGEAINGTVKLLQAIHEQGERISACVTGEPTSNERLGDTIKIGRRGSMHGWLCVHGRQGHTGYPHLAQNAAHDLVCLLAGLEGWKLDQGSAFFQPSTVAITRITVDNNATNIIPGEARAHFNIRFNDLHDCARLEQKIHDRLKRIVAGRRICYELEVRCSGDSFLTKVSADSFCVHLRDAIKHQTGISSEFSTAGGTSDSRFIKNYCNVVDFGLCGTRMHQIDEAAPVGEIELLARIYQEFIKRFMGYS
ncbi:MAG: succinyl-diaminopimelate desuccinylase [Pseudomonadota bacterium]